MDGTLAPGVTTCSVTYCVEGFVRCVELVTLHSDQEYQQEPSLSCLDFDEGCNLGVSARLAVSPPECEIVRSKKTQLSNGKDVPVTLRLVNNSNIDLMDMYIRSRSPACNISWLDSDEGQMGMF
jgi:hypothetical protein